MPDAFDVAGAISREGNAPDRRRQAARIWLAEAIDIAMSRGEDVAPAIQLLAALEGLDFGRADPMLKLPEGLSRGGAKKAPAQLGFEMLVLASADVLFGRQGHSYGARKATDQRVEDAAAIAAGRLRKLRENFTECYSGEMDRLRLMTDEEILSEIERVASLFGRHGPSE